MPEAADNGFWSVCSDLLLYLLAKSYQPLAMYQNLTDKSKHS